MKQQIDDARRLILASQEAREKLLQLRPDAGQGGQRSEKRVEYLGRIELIVILEVPQRPSKDHAGP